MTKKNNRWKSKEKKKDEWISLFLFLIYKRSVIPMFF